MLSNCIFAMLNEDILPLRSWLENKYELYVRWIMYAYLSTDILIAVLAVVTFACLWYVYCYM